MIEATIKCDVCQKVTRATVVRAEVPYHGLIEAIDGPEVCGDWAYEDTNERRLHTCSTSCRQALVNMNGQETSYHDSLTGEVVTIKPVKREDMN